MSKCDLIQRAVSPAEVAIGEVIEGAEMPGVADIALYAPPSIRILDVARPPQSAIDAIELSPAGDIGEYHIRVSLRGDLHRGPLSEYWELIADDGGGRRTLRVPVTAQVVPDVELLPPQMILGAHLPGSIVGEYVTIASRSGRSLTAVEIADSPENVAVAVVEELSDAEQMVLHVETRIAEVGRVDSQIKFAVRTSGRPDMIAVELPLVAIGLAEDAGRIVQMHENTRPSESAE